MIMDEENKVPKNRLVIIKIIIFINMLLASAICLLNNAVAMNQTIRKAFINSMGEANNNFVSSTFFGYTFLFVSVAIVAYIIILTILDNVKIFKKNLKVTNIVLIISIIFTIAFIGLNIYANHFVVANNIISLVGNTVKV